MSERERLQHARAQVRSLRTEVDELEALVDEPHSAASAAAIGAKVPKVLASNAAAAKALYAQQPPAKSARAIPSSSAVSAGAQQQPAPSHVAPRPAPPPRQRSIGTGPADDDAIVASHVQQLVAEGFSSDAALAALQAVDGTSLTKAREWLKTHQCGSGTKTARVLRTQQQQDPPAAPGDGALSSGAAAVGPSPPLPSYRPGGPAFPRSLEKGSVGSAAPSGALPAPLHQNLVTAKSAASQASTPAFGAQLKQSRLSASAVAKPGEGVCCMPDPDEAATVSIKVRNLEGQVQEVTQLFRPSDALLTVLTAYLREHPLPPAKKLTAAGLQVVVPLERKTYAYDEMRGMSLTAANLVPRATVVLQVKKK